MAWALGLESRSCENYYKGFKKEQASLQIELRRIMKNLEILTHDGFENKIIKLLFIFGLSSQ